MKKLNWLEQFAKQQQEKLNKTASLEKKAEQAVVDADVLSTTEQDATVEFMGEQYKVVDANYSDEKGPGVLIEKIAFVEEIPAVEVPAATGGQEYARSEMNTTEQTYTNDEDAANSQNAAAATEQAIAQENAVDRTTVDGHYSTTPAAVIETPEEIVVEETPEITEEVPAEEVTEVTEEISTEETPVEETQEEVTEENTEEVQEDVTEEVKEDKLASNRILARIFNSKK